MLYVKARIPAAPETCPKRVSFTLVYTPEYCTVLNTLLTFNRISRLRVSPKEIDRESDELTDTVPGSSIELRVAFPYVPNAGAVKTEVLNHCLSVPEPFKGFV